jgi:hypothetical protein
MRRVLPALVTAMVMSLTFSAVAFGAKPGTGCPSDASGFVRVDRDGWWVATVEGFEIEGIDVYEEDGVTFTADFDAFAMSFGFADGAALQEFILVINWPTVDKNGNGFMCKKLFPEQGNGKTAYFFNAVDDQSSSGQ